MTESKYTKNKEYVHFDFEINDAPINIHFEKYFLDDNRLDVLSFTVRDVLRQAFDKMELPDIKINGRCSLRRGKKAGLNEKY